MSKYSSYIGAAVMVLVAVFGLSICIYFVTQPKNSKVYKKEIIKRHSDVDTIFTIMNKDTVSYEVFYSTKGLPDSVVYWR